MPKTRDSKAPLCVGFSREIDDYLNAPSAADGFYPSVCGGLAAVRDCDKLDVRMRGCSGAEAEEGFFGERTATVAEEGKDRWLAFEVREGRGRS